MFYFKKKNLDSSRTFKFEFIILLSIILFGIFLCFVGGYGSHEDTLPMIGVFLGILRDKVFMTSRFTGNPVAEIGIGFLSYFFGSWAANLITFLLFIFSLFFLFFSFANKNKKILLLFLILCLTNPSLFFINLQPIDAPWALFFLFLGVLLLSLKYYEIACLAFGFCIGTRIYFLLFVIIFTFFFPNKNISYNRKFFIIIVSWIIGGLFYLPVWYHSQFSLQWFDAAIPSEQGLIGFLGRFSYKVWFSVGLIQFFIILYLLLKKFDLLKKINGFYSLSLGILTNLLIFLIMPIQLYYLQPFLVLLYFLLVQLSERKIIYMIIFINLLTWLISFQVFKFTYKSNDICSPRHATNVEFQLDLSKGNLFEYLYSRQKIKCWINEDSDFGKKIIKGEKLR
jgi:hypothetical protein